jgi:SRSO17 transposase
VPAEVRGPQARWEIALGLLDAALADGLPVRTVVAPAGYGTSEAFRAGVAARGLEFEDQGDSVPAGPGPSHARPGRDPAATRPAPSRKGSV